MINFCQPKISSSHMCAAKWVNCIWFSFLGELPGGTNCLISTVLFILARVADVAVSHLDGWLTIITILSRAVGVAVVYHYRSPGNNSSGHYFRHYFFFSSVIYFSHRRSDWINKTYFAKVVLEFSCSHRKNKSNILSVSRSEDPIT